MADPNRLPMYPAGPMVNQPLAELQWLNRSAIPVVPKAPVPRASPVLSTTSATAPKTPDPYTAWLHTAGQVPVKPNTPAAQEAADLRTPAEKAAAAAKPFPGLPTVADRVVRPSPADSVFPSLEGLPMRGSVGGAAPFRVEMSGRVGGAFDTAPSGPSPGWPLYPGTTVPRVPGVPSAAPAAQTLLPQLTSTAGPVVPTSYSGQVAGNPFNAKDGWFDALLAAKWNKNRINEIARNSISAFEAASGRRSATSAALDATMRPSVENSRLAAQREGVAVTTNTQRDIEAAREMSAERIAAIRADATLRARKMAIDAGKMSEAPPSTVKLENVVDAEGKPVGERIALIGQGGAVQIVDPQAEYTSQLLAQRVFNTPVGGTVTDATGAPLGKRVDVNGVTYYEEAASGKRHRIDRPKPVRGAASAPMNMNLPSLAGPYGY